MSVQLKVWRIWMAGEIKNWKMTVFEEINLVVSVRVKVKLPA